MKHGVLIAVAALGLAAGCSGRLPYDETAYGFTSLDSGVDPGPTPPPPSMAPAPAPAPDAGSKPDRPPPPSPPPSPPPPSPPPPPSKMDGGSVPDAPPAAACAPGTDALSILAAKCGTCHNATTPTKELDLVTPGVARRLVGIRSTCDGRNFLEPPPGPARGYFLEKLKGPVENCGEIMPFAAPPLTADEKSCLFDWAEKAVARGVTPGN